MYLRSLSCAASDRCRQAPALMPGLLYQGLENPDCDVEGLNSDIFSSANLDHRKASQEQRLLKETVVFETNRLCTLAAPGVTIDRNALLAQLLATSTRVTAATPVIDSPETIPGRCSEKPMHCILGLLIY